MIQRILVGAGLFFLGYYMGRELQRGEFLRQELQGGNRPTRYPPGGAGSADTPSGTDPAPDPGQGNS